MSWEDQGRQEHGWFGNGTAPPKDSAGGSEAEPRPSDAASIADTAAVRAGAWAKAYGPVLFGLPRGGAALDRFAEAVMRRERARPGSVVRALDRWAAQGKFGEQASAVHDGLRTLVSDDAGERVPRYYNPLGVFIPGTPENEVWTHDTERAIGAAGRAIGRVFNSQSQGGDASAPPVPDATPGRRDQRALDTVGKAWRNGGGRCRLRCRASRERPSHSWRWSSRYLAGWP